MSRAAPSGSMSFEYESDFEVVSKEAHVVLAIANPMHECVDVMMDDRQGSAGDASVRVSRRGAADVGMLSCQSAESLDTLSSDAEVSDIIFPGNARVGMVVKPGHGLSVSLPDEGHDVQTPQQRSRSWSPPASPPPSPAGVSPDALQARLEYGARAMRRIRRKILSTVGVVAGFSTMAMFVFVEMLLQEKHWWAIIPVQFFGAVAFFSTSMAALPSDRIMIRVALGINAFIGFLFTGMWIAKVDQYRRLMLSPIACHEFALNTTPSSVVDGRGFCASGAVSYSCGMLGALAFSWMCVSAQVLRSRRQQVKQLWTGIRVLCSTSVLCWAWPLVVT